MSLPFGLWDANDAFNKALEYEEEQEEQLIEEEIKAEDEFVVRLSPTLESKIGSENKQCLDVSKLIICTDNVSSGFLDAYYLSQGATKVGLVLGKNCEEKEENSVHQNAFWDKTCFIYSIANNKDVLVCQSKRKIESNYMFDWVEKVFSKIKPECVIILTSVPRCKLQIQNQGDESHADILRQLRSENFCKKTNIPALEKPNLIRGLAAAVMMHCQVHGIAAILYVLATESFLFDVNAVKSFSPLMQEESFRNLQQSTADKTKEVLKILCDMKIEDKGVYI